MTDPTYFYLTAQDYRSQTKAPALVDPLTEEEVRSLLLETMTEIDAYIGPGWTPYDDEQEFTFPRQTDADPDPVIPRPVAIATRIIADAKLLAEKQGVLPHMVDSESGLGRSYTRRKRTVEPPVGFEHWPDTVFAHLDRYRQVGGAYAMSYPDALHR